MPSFTWACLQAAFPSAQHMHFANLLRWADTVQSLVGDHIVRQTLPQGPLRVHKPPFVPPPPPAPAATAAKVGAAITREGMDVSLAIA